MSSINENLFSNLITIFVLFAMFVLGYCGLMKKTIFEFFQDIFNLFKGGKDG